MFVFNKPTSPNASVTDYAGDEASMSSISADPRTASGNLKITLLYGFYGKLFYKMAI